MTTKFKPGMTVYALRGLPGLVKGTILSSSGRWHMVKLEAREEGAYPDYFHGQVKAFSSKDLLSLDDPKVEALRPLVKEFDLINETQEKIDERWRDLEREADKVLGRKRRR